MATVVLEPREHPVHGRGLYTTRHVKGGEVLLKEAPVLLIAANRMKDVTCANCLRSIQAPNGGTCLTCQQATFCSPECAQTATSVSWVHGQGVCKAYQALAVAEAAALTADANGSTTDMHLQDGDVDAGRFLAHALALRAQDNAGRYAALLALEGEPGEPDMRAVGRLAPVLEQALGPLGVAGQELAALLCKEQLNSYGILAPQHAVPQVASSEGADQEDEEGSRVLRGSAIYATASLINHECNPNVARFDAFDAPPGTSGTTHVVFRAMHDLPPGTEVFQSYVPISWDYEERQEHLQDVYGFTCACQRCKLEATWEGHAAAARKAKAEAGESSSEWETDDAEDGDVGMADGEAGEHEQGCGTACSHGDGLPGAGGHSHHHQDHHHHHHHAPRFPHLPQQLVEADPGPLEPTYLQLFLLKYVCATPGCFGTCAPTAPGSGQLSCSVCGVSRAEDDFLADLGLGA